jgi:hypothetical protein
MQVRQARVLNTEGAHQDRVKCGGNGRFLGRQARPTLAGPTPRKFKLGVIEFEHAQDPAPPE